MSCTPQPGHERASEIYRSVKPSPSLNGLHHLGDDGVLRSFSSQGVVVDYKRLSPDEIEAVLTSLSKLVDSEQYQQVAKVMEGVDGRDVTDIEQILHPGPELRPPPTLPPQDASTERAETGTCLVGKRKV